MRRVRRYVMVAVALGAFGALSGEASAAVKFDYSVSLYPAITSPTAGGSISVDRLDSGLTTRVVVSPPSGPARFDQTFVAGSSSSSSGHIPGLSVGDTITIRQPSGGPPTETFVIPAASISLVPGSNVISGTMPAGYVGTVQGDYRCDLKSSGFTFGAGPFSFPHPTIVPGETASLGAANASGDRLSLDALAPGETPCIDIFGADRVPDAIGSPANPAPYNVTVGHLNAATATSVRVVIRRGGLVLIDSFDDSNTLSNKKFATRPLPGDIVDIYRPKTAPAPTYSVTIPQVSSKFDPTIDAVAVDSPAAGLIIALPCRALGCSFENVRATLDVPAGRNFLNFGQPQGQSPAVDLRPDDVINVGYVDPDHRISYSFGSALGDLVAPAQSFKLPSKLRLSKLLKALKKGFKLGLKSNEAGQAKISLVLPAASSSAKKKPRSITLARATKGVQIGTTTITLKFTKSGKRALKKLSTRRPRSVIFTSTLTDASGNVSTIAKRAKIKP